MLTEQQRNTTAQVQALAAEMEVQAAKQDKVNAEFRSILHSIQHELTGRKEFGRGVKAAIVVFWMASGGVIVSMVLRVIEFLTKGAG